VIQKTHFDSKTVFLENINEKIPQKPNT